jgi:hypothetical protein
VAAQQLEGLMGRLREAQGHMAEMEAQLSAATEGQESWRRKCEEERAQSHAIQEQVASLEVRFGQRTLHHCFRFPHLLRLTMGFSAMLNAGIFNGQHVIDVFPFNLTQWLHPWR